MCDATIAEAVRLVESADLEMINSNIDAAKELYLKAGELLSNHAAPMKSGILKAKTMYSAALALYKGGDYTRSYALLGNTQANLLHGGEFPELYQACKEKNSQAHMDANQMEMEKSIGRMASGDAGLMKMGASKMLDILRDSPYILPPMNLLKKRIEALECLGRNDEAEMFKKDLARLENKTISYHVA